MNRSEFLKTLGLGVGGIVLPPTLFEQKAIKIYDNYIMGMNYYDYKKIKKALQIASPLQLKREATNLHDSFAIEVYYQEHKIGYIKAYENIVLSNMIDAGAKIKAEVSSHDPSKSYHDRLSVAVYSELIIATPKLLNELHEIRADEAEDIYRKGPNL